MASSTRTSRPTRKANAAVAAPPAPAAEAQESPKENPRTARSKERLALACSLIAKELESGEWVSSNEIHRRLNDEIADGMFGRAKKELGIEHRRTRGANGKPEYEWRLAKQATKK